MKHCATCIFLGKKSERGFSRYIILDWKMFKASICHGMRNISRYIFQRGGKR